MPKTNRRRRRKGNGQQGWKGTQRTVVKARVTEAPDEMDVVLRYPLTFVLKDAVHDYVARRFTPNGPYDIDPTLGSTAVPGFVEWTLFYAFYRVTSYMIDCEIANNEQVPIIAYSINVNQDPGTSGLNYESFSAGPYCKHHMMGGNTTGSSRCRIKHSILVSKLVGTNAIDTDTSFRGTASANPANTVWWGLGIRTTIGAATLANGVSVNLYVTMRIKFYDRYSLLTMFTSDSPLVKKVLKDFFDRANKGATSSLLLEKK